MSSHKARLSKLETERGTSEAMTWKMLITFSEPEWQNIIQSDPKMAADWARVTELLDIAQARKDEHDRTEEIRADIKRKIDRIAEAQTPCKPQE